MSRFDENALRALFEELDAPAVVDDRWRTKAALAVLDTPGEPSVTRLPELTPQRVSPRARLAAAAIAALVTAAIAVGVVASNRLPPTDPLPNPSETVTMPPAPPTSASVPSSDALPPEAGTGTGDPSAPGGQRPAPPAPGPKPGKPATGQGNPVVPPARGPLSEWPDSVNAGVPPGTTLYSHPGDLHVTMPGTVIHDLRVDGTVFVEAPDVTLLRVQVVVPGEGAGVRQLPQAPRLTVEDSTLDVQQQAAGLTVRRSTIAATTLGVRDALVVDSYLLGSVHVVGDTTHLVLRHNTIHTVNLDDSAGPVTDVTIEGNQLGGWSQPGIWAPTGPGSRDIHVLSNQFHPNTSPAIGWTQAPGNTWSGNVWFGTNEPASPS